MTVRYKDATTTKDVLVSQDTPLPVTSGVEMGALDDAAWNGSTGDPASIMALLKGIMAQLVAINAKP